MKQSFGIGFFLGIVFIVMVGWVGIEKTKSTITPEQEFKSAPNQLVIADAVYHTPLTPAELWYLASQKSESNRQYDTLIVNVIPFIPKPSGTYTVTQDSILQIVTFHFFGKKKYPGDSMFIDYDSLRQNPAHFWNYVD